MIAAAFAGLTAALLAPGAASSADPATTSLRQHVVVAWHDGGDTRRTRESFSLVGIGSGEIVCRPDAAFIRMRPNDPTAETTMWSTLFETKGGVTYPAVHNARVYRFSTPTSTIPHGTGRRAHEGFNQLRQIEDASQGRAFGLISQRTGRNQPGAGTAPSTSFRLHWRWSGFRDGNSRCRIVATLITPLPSGDEVRERTLGGLKRSPGPPANGLNLAWHGNPDAAGKDVSKLITVPYLGTLGAGCAAGADSDPSLAMRADNADDGPAADVITYEGEGPDAATPSRYVTDPLNGLLGPIPLPVNGMMTVRIADRRHSARLVVSSLRKTNDPDGADNSCEIAVQMVSDGA